MKCHVCGSRMQPAVTDLPFKVRDLCKTPPFAQFLCQAQILILKILNVFLWLKFSHSLNLNKIEHFSKVSVNDTTIVIMKDLPVIQCDGCSEYLIDDPVLLKHLAASIPGGIQTRCLYPCLPVMSALGANIRK